MEGHTSLTMTGASKMGPEVKDDPAVAFRLLVETLVTVKEEITQCLENRLWGYSSTSCLTDGGRRDLDLRAIFLTKTPYPEVVKRKQQNKQGLLGEMTGSRPGTGNTQHELGVLVGPDSKMVLKKKEMSVRSDERTQKPTQGRRQSPKLQQAGQEHK